MANRVKLQVVLVGLLLGGALWWQAPIPPAHVIRCLACPTPTPTRYERCLACPTPTAAP